MHRPCGNDSCRSPRLRDALIRGYNARFSRFSLIAATFFAVDSRMKNVLVTQ